MTNETTAPETTAMPADAALDSSRQGPGRLIRLAREHARLGIVDLAGLTKLAASTLEALERDDFAMLNEPVYVRGYYRKCAKALAVSEQDLIAAYERMVKPKAPQAPTKLLLGSSETGSSLRKSRRRPEGRWLVWLVGIAAFVGGAAWLLHVDPNAHRISLMEPVATPRPADQAAAASPAVAAPAPSPPPPVAAAGTGDTRPASTNELATTPSDRGLETASPATPAPPPAPPQPALSPRLSVPVQAPPALPVAAAPGAVPSPPAAGGSALVLGFAATSWVRVEDAAGKLLLSGVIQGGDRQVVSGAPPYSVFLGNAPGVTVEYQGRAIDLRPFTKSNDTARLNVPAAAN